MFFPALSPDSVDNRITAFECADTARRSRTTERSESVSEEAEERLKWHFLLTHLCGISHRIWCTLAEQSAPDARIVKPVHLATAT
ncbi:hypothetical protein AB2G17_26450 (plasmid) [Escherichia coli]